ncbi:hypothetical protein PAXRUDRAFT_155861, partial [Paxillus rubicundulus Ve08.2h10]
KNATTHPGNIVLQSEVKRRTRAEKAADDKCLKETQAAKEQAAVEGLNRLADMEVRMEAKEAEPNGRRGVRP